MKIKSCYMFAILARLNKDCIRISSSVYCCLIYVKMTGKNHINAGNIFSKFSIIAFCITSYCIYCKTFVREKNNKLSAASS